ncbi:TasA family protein [Patescibacteria group bacterium]
MKKILLSVMTIGIVAVVGVFATQALFSDTETEGPYTFGTGTIDIAVDGQNPWGEIIGQHELLDMKPSYTGYFEFEIQNVGSNPANIWKTLFEFETKEVESSEPELAVDPLLNIHNIDDWINYDMRVELYKPGVQEPVWWETIYMDKDNVKIGELENVKMYLGMIPADWSMKVIQSYHMVDGAGNMYQGDGMSFGINIYAEQLTNTVRLENKFESNSSLSHTLWDDTYADLTYKVMDDKFRYDLYVYGMTLDGAYTLVAWEDNEDATPYSWTWGQFSGTTVLADVTVSGGTAYVTGEVDLEEDLTNSKVWLVPGDLGDAGDTGIGLPWTDAVHTLFETGLIDFYDSSI